MSRSSLTNVSHSNKACKMQNSFLIAPSFEDALYQTGHRGKKPLKVIAPEQGVSYSQLAHALAARPSKLSCRHLVGLMDHGGPAPYGYYLDSPHLKIKEGEAKIVRLIFDLADRKNMGVINIARHLNDQKIKGIRGPWRQNTVYRILTNPVYMGELNWGGERVAGTHKPIVKEAQFKKIQKDLKIRKAKTRGLVSPNLLTGLIFCKCSSAMHVLYPGTAPKNKYKYYVCTDRSIHKSCKTDYIRADLLECAIVDKIKEFYSDEKLFTDAINSLKARGMAELPALKKRKIFLAGKISRLSRQKEGLLKWMGERGAKPYTLNAVNEKLEKIEPELNESNYELMTVKEACEKMPALACSSKNAARDVLRSLASFTDFSFGEKKRLLCEVIHKIKVDSKKEVHLFLKVPERVNSFGLTFPIGSLHKEKTQNADYFYRTKLSLIDYYKNKAQAR